MKVTVSDLTPDDKKQWEKLYYDYAEFYNVPMNSEILDTIWLWIFDENNRFFALIAKNELDDTIGFMHCREVPSSLLGTVVGFLDDLYVIPKYRGTGCVQVLYTALNDLGKKRGWPFIEWMTADDNYRGRASYDKIAEKTHWLTYQMSVK